jgi:hypothetical protein
MHELSVYELGVYDVLHEDAAARLQRSRGVLTGSLLDHSLLIHC